MRVLIGTDRDKKLIELIRVLENDDISVEDGEINSGIIVIPPGSAVLRLIGKDFDKKQQNTFVTRLLSFLEDYPQGIILVEGYQRFGNVKKTWMQETQIEMIQTGFKNLRFRGMIPTRNISDSAIFIKRLVIREQVEDIPPEISRKVGKTKFLFEAQIAFIEGLALCGKKKAKKLLEKFGTPDAIIKLILSDPDQIRNIKGFGDNFIHENQKLLKNILDK